MRVFIPLYLAYCLSFIDRLAMALALTLIAKDFDLSPLAMGAVLSSFYFGYALTQIPGGWASDRWGSKKVVLIAVLSWSLFTALTGLAGSLTTLICIRLLFGLAEGVFPAASLKAVAEHFEPERRPALSSLLVSANYVGSMIAPLVVAPLLILVGWRHMFLGIGILGVIIAIAYLLFVPDRPNDRRLPPSVPRTAPQRLLNQRWLWLLASAWFGLSCVNKGLDAWMPTYLMEVRHLDLKTVGFVSPLPFAAASVATALGGWIMIKFFSNREKYMLMASASIAGIFLYSMYRAHTVTELVVFQCLLYFFKSFTLAVVVALPLKLLAAERIGTAAGIVNLGGQIAGFVAPLTMGFLLNRSGSHEASFVFLLVMTGLSVLAAAALSPPPGSLGSKKKE